MSALQVACVLLDVEGTTSSVSYVYDVLFPYARHALLPYLQEHWQEAATIKAVDFLAADLGYKCGSDWLNDLDDEPSRIERVGHELTRLMDSDVKSTGLKELQGLVWAIGYSEGKLRSHVYSDVPAAFKRWQASGISMRIYSSGSIAAQKVFFANTEYGALIDYLSGHYDTTTGPKREPASYTKIAADTGLPPARILFLSDVPAELDAAASAGMQVALVIRPGNSPVPEHSYLTIDNFTELDLVAPAEVYAKSGKSALAAKDPTTALRPGNED
jgi:enolase-phosphatase E1